jgi:hypothetical protein
MNVLSESLATLAAVGLGTAAVFLTLFVNVWVANLTYRPTARR